MATNISYNAAVERFRDDEYPMLRGKQCLSGLRLSCFAHAGSAFQDQFTLTTPGLPHAPNR